MQEAVEHFNTSEVALCRELTGNEIRFITVVSKFQEAGHASRQEIADFLGVCKLTISRIIKSLKDKGFLVVKRIGATLWRYFFQGPYINGVAYQKCSGSICTSDPIISNIENNNTYVGSQKCEASRLVLSGPKSPLLEAIQECDRPYGLKLKNRPPKDTRTKMEKAREAMSKKNVGQYNCADLWLIFFDLWKEKWGGHVPSWTGKDRGLVKRLLGLYGPKVVVDYFNHVFKKWDDLAVRYKVNGYPTLGILSVYSKSWLPEMQHGKVFNPDSPSGKTTSEEDRKWMEERGIEVTAPKEKQYITLDDGRRVDKEAHEYAQQMEYDNTMKSIRRRIEKLKSDEAYARQYLADISSSPYIAEKARKWCEMHPAFAALLEQLRVQFKK